MTRGITVGGVFLAVAGVAAPAHAGGGSCTAFSDQAEFEAFCFQQGSLMKGLENFEPPTGHVPVGQLAELTPRLEGNVQNIDPANGFGFPDGLANKNLVIQTNDLGHQAPDIVPGNELVALGQNRLGEAIPNSIVVGPNFPADSLDLIFGPGESHSGIGFDVIAPDVEGGDIHISVFNETNVLIALEVVPAGVDKVFFGIWCPVAIGRINIGALGLIGQDGGELVDNIQMWMESAQEPVCPCDCALPHDKMVGVLDILGALAQWGQPGPCDCEDPPDGAADVGDILAILSAWGPCPAPDNDQCAGQEPVEIVNPEGTTAAVFDMYGATASPDLYKCLKEDPVHKDIWYCLTNATDEPVKVTILTSIALFVDVNEGCGCPPGALITCGEGLIGTDQFEMEAGQQVLIRLIDFNDLPNDQLSGSMLIQSEPVIVDLVNFFEQSVLFDEAVAETGAFMEYSWSFKNDYLQKGQDRTIDDPLDIETHQVNAPGVWWDDEVDLWPPEVHGVQFSSNLNPPEPWEPHGFDGMLYGKPGAFADLNHNALVARWFADSFDILGFPLGASNHTAMGLELIGLDGNAGPQAVSIQVSVYDNDDVQMGTYEVNGFQGEKLFLGILTKDPAFTFGRVDIWDTVRLQRCA
jgi:hypothetical protein